MGRLAGSKVLYRQKEKKKRSWTRTSKGRSRPARRRAGMWGFVNSGSAGPIIPGRRPCLVHVGVLIRRLEALKILLDRAAAGGWLSCGWIWTFHRRRFSGAAILVSGNCPNGRCRSRDPPPPLNIRSCRDPGFRGCFTISRRRVVVTSTVPAVMAGGAMDRDEGDGMRALAQCRGYLSTFHGR